MTKTTDTRMQAALVREKYYLLNKHLLECYQKIIKKENINGLIKQHKRLINSLQFNNKKPPKSLSYLENFSANLKSNREMAIQIFSNTLNNKGIFSLQ